MISVVIPAYNEEDAIGETINEINRVMSENNLGDGCEIIVVNDGSTDNTRQIAIQSGATVLDNSQNMGYGYSLKQGIMYAKNKTIIITDADTTYPFSYIPKMIKEKEKGIDLVVGARTGMNYTRPIIKNILRKLLKRFVEFVSGKKVRDINSGLRIFDKETVMKFFPRLCNAFSFTTSQTLAYLMNNLKISYVDVPYSSRKGKSKIRLLRDSAKSVKYVLEAGIYYNPLKIFTILTITCILLSVICFVFSHCTKTIGGHILGIIGLGLSIITLTLGIFLTLHRKINQRKND